MYWIIYFVLITEINTIWKKLLHLKSASGNEEKIIFEQAINKAIFHWVVLTLGVLEIYSCIRECRRPIYNNFIIRHPRIIYCPISIFIIYDIGKNSSWVTNCHPMLKLQQTHFNGKVLITHPDLLFDSSMQNKKDM